MISRIILAALALAMAANFYLTDRRWSLTSMPGVAEIATLPDDPQLASVRRYTEIGSGLLPYSGARAARARGSANPPLKIGWSYREVSLLGMPFWAYSEGGMVTYLELPQGIQVAILGRERIALLDRLTGRDYSNASFPWYKYLWGWLFVIGLLAWTRIKGYEQRREEERGLA